MKQVKKELSHTTIVYDASNDAGERWGVVQPSDTEYSKTLMLAQQDIDADGEATCVVMQYEKIDIRGLNQEEKTLIVNGAVVQEPYFYTMEVRSGGTGPFVAAGTGSGIFVNDVMLNCLLFPQGETYDDQLESYYLSLLQPGFQYSNLNFENVMFAQTRQLAMTNITGAWASPEEMSRNNIGSGAPNAGEFVYCYRMFVIEYNGLAAADDLRVTIPPARYLIGATIKEEADYVRMMRLARQYEPYQRYDRD